MPMVEQYEELSKKQSSKPELVLVRTPETGIPKYVSCEVKEYRKWVVFAVITAVAALVLTFCLIAKKKRF